MKKRLNRLVVTALVVLMMLSVQDPTLADQRLRYLWNAIDDDIADISDDIFNIFRRETIRNSPRIASQYQSKLKNLATNYAKQSMSDNYRYYGGVTDDLLDVVNAETLSKLRDENDKARDYGYAVSDATLKAIALQSTYMVAQFVINWEKEKETERTAY